MSKLLAGTIKSISLSAQEAEMAKRSSEAIFQFISPEPHLVHLRLEDRQTGAQIEAAVPNVVIKLLGEALAKLANGQSVTLVPLEAEMSTQKAAEILSVSRPFFIKLLEQGEIPYRKVGEQRRVRCADLLEYRSVYQRKATIALDEMAAEMQALNLYD